MGGKRLSEHTKNEIIGLNKAGFRNIEIEEKTGVSAPTISKVILRYKASTERVCQKCGAKLAEGSRFCHMCGTDVRTEADKIVERIENQRRLFSLIQDAGTRDEFIATLNDAIRFIKGGVIMPAHRKDLTGQRFGRLVAVKDVGRSKKGQRLWELKCDCGNTTVLPTCEIGNCGQKSCGCLKKETLEKQQENSRTHGMTGTRLYNIWCGMKKRCYTPSTHEFENYGGRGIAVCDEWRNSFEAFRDWALSNGYRSDLTIDRKDNDKGYSPENCRWATYYEQIHNRRKNPTVNGGAL